MSDTAPQSPIQASSSETAPLNPWTNLFFGLKVLQWELKWLVRSQVRTFEIRQLERKIRKESALVGAWVVQNGFSKSPRPSLNKLEQDMDEATALAVKQIQFLQEEKDYLCQELAEAKEAFQKRRDAAFNQ